VKERCSLDSKDSVDSTLMGDYHLSALGSLAKMEIIESDVKGLYA
jgi:hypothetical protein